MQSRYFGNIEIQRSRANDIKQSSTQRFFFCFFWHVSISFSNQKFLFLLVFKTQESSGSGERV